METLKAKVQEKYPVRGLRVGWVGGRVRWGERQATELRRMLVEVDLELKQVSLLLVDMLLRA